MSTSPYHESGRLLDQILTQRRSLRSVFYSGGGRDRKLRCTKATFASVCNTLKHRGRIDAILNRNGGELGRCIKFDDARNKGLLYVLMYELLYGKYGSVRGGGRVKRNVVKYEKELRRAKKELEAEGGGGGAAFAELSFPRYLRVNTLKISLEEAVDVLRRDVLRGGGGGGGEGDEIYADRHVPDLLVLPPSCSSRLHSHDLVASGKVVPQDKSSCFSALALGRGLSPELGSDAEDCGSDDDDDDDGNNDGVPFDCIDACSAPGNKTTHLAALLAQEMERRAGGAEGGGKQKKKKKGGGRAAADRCKIFALDRSSKRIRILRDRLADLVPTGGESPYVEVEPWHRDFLKTDPSERELARVRCILLDPSCSGSGIVSAPDRLADTAGRGYDEDGSEERRRVEALANFQLVALKHSMSFPQVDRIVYSTCSVHDMENEHVVAWALREHNEGVEESMQWEVVLPDCFRHWERRGHAAAGLTEPQSKCLIRCDGLDGDDTNGFFVCYLERKRFSNRHRRRREKRFKEGTTSRGVLPFYSREYSMAREKEKDEIKSSPNTKQSKDQNATEVRKGDERSVSFSSRERKDSAKKGICKKKAKKLAWKRKQRELKMVRLQKKRSQGTREGAGENGPK